MSDSWIDGWETLEIDGAVEGDPAAHSLAQGLRQGGATLHTESRMHTWCRPCEGSWDDCLDAMSRKSRRKTRRLLARCDPAGGPLEFRISASREQLHRDLDAIISLHQRRWNEKGQSGSFADDAFRQFVHDAGDGLFERDRILLATLWRGEQAVAGSLQLLGENQSIYCYTSGYCMSHADLEPGLVLNVVILRYAYQRGFAAVDYLRGDEPYKARFKAEPRRLLKLRAVAPAWFPRLCHAAWMTGFELKQFVRKRIGRKPIDVVDLTASPLPQP